MNSPITGAFPLARPVGFFVPGSVLGQGELELWNQAIAQSLNAGGGGVWANTTPISIGGAWVFANGASVEVQAGVTVTFDAVSTLNLAGQTNVQGGAFLTVNSGGFVELQSGASAQVDSGATITVLSGGLLDVFGNTTIESGGFIKVLSGGLITVQTGATLLVGNGATFSLSGTGVMTTGGGTTVTLGGTSKFSSTGTLEIDCHTTIDATRLLTISGTAEVSFNTGGFISGTPLLKGGSQLTAASGSIIESVSGATVVLLGSTTIAPSGGGDVTDITMSGTTNVKLATRSVTRKVRGPLNTIQGGIPTWTILRNGTAFCDSGVFGAGLNIPLDFLHGATLTQLSVRFQGGAGHSAFPGGKPSNMPRLQIFKQAGGVDTQIGTTTTDASSTAAAFEAAHSLVVNLTETIDQTQFNYYAVLTSESGTNELVGDTFLDAFTVTTPANYDDGR